jgi:hypothetical protein
MPANGFDDTYLPPQHVFAPVAILPESVGVRYQEHSYRVREKVQLGEGIMILRFRRDMQYQNHLALIRHLQNKRVFPLLRVYALEPGVPVSDKSQLILLTGTMTEAQKVAPLYFTPEAESFVDSRLNGDWNSLNADSTCDNVPMIGCSLDVGSCHQRVEEVLEGEYRVVPVV